MKKQAVIYCRTATPQTGSLEVQESECRKAAKRMGYQVNRVFLDDGQSGVKLERPGLGGLIVFCVLHPELVSAVFVKGYDRLARDIKQLVTIHDRLQSMNIAIYAGEQSSAFATNKFAFGVVKMMADYERSVRAERAQHGKHHKKSN